MRPPLYLRRHIVRDCALRYLGVTRLPRGVPEVLDYVARGPDWEQPWMGEMIARLMRPYRRLPWVL